MNLILFGPPGAGKGTQSQYIVKKHNYFQLSTGDLLRNEVIKKTEHGKKIENILSEGKFVSDDIVNPLLITSLKNQKDKNGIIFDGYPRSIDQANNLENLLLHQEEKVDLIIFLNVSRDVIQKRLLGRVTCEKCNITLNEFFNQKEIEIHKCGKENLKRRKDDNHDTVISRYDTYMEKTKPVLEFYSKKPEFHEIDGSLEIEVIKGKIDLILGV